MQMKINAEALVELLKNAIRIGKPEVGVALVEEWVTKAEAVILEYQKKLEPDGIIKKLIEYRNLSRQTAREWYASPEYCSQHERDLLYILDKLWPEKISALARSNDGSGNSARNGT